MTAETRDLAALIADVPDFPKVGVSFKDITPLLSSPEAFQACVDALVAASPTDIDVVCGMEARGFIFGAPVALAMGASFVPVRKSGKLPRDTVETTYDLEYGTQTLAIHSDAIKEGDRVLIVDDVLATGGTVAATADLVRRLGGSLVAVSVVMELAYLEPREVLGRHRIDDVTALVTYSE
ncbi:adenine phosphoribosyltransferase [Serinibacter arcticus]|uniref:Adenine phosphoribosyltransferase n=1 Tax=Serinibacter arcticus TaxID=1655435 RepID=A0A2U1ZVC5_9MICO|nr:adenine phosphoribosyltransferase [Serinibacter arcticus]PWD50947.1 adenine phosphoribosyltransferase [Serinibacter arcticus]